MKTCIACAEEIQSAALLCRHCGTDQRDERFSDLASIDKTEAARQPEHGPEGDSARPTLDNPVTDWAKGLLGRIENPKSLFKDALKSLSNLWVDISVYLEKTVLTPSSRKILGIAAVNLAGIAVMVGFFAPLNVISGVFAPLNSFLGGGFGSGKYSASSACTDLSQTYQDYFNELDAFRYSDDDGSGWTPLENLTNKAKGRVASAQSKIRSNGIDWDSEPIVLGLLADASSDMSEIVSSAKRGYFSPGRSLDGILSDIDRSLNSVANSACN